MYVAVNDAAPWVINNECKTDLHTTHSKDANGKIYAYANESNNVI